MKQNNHDIKIRFREDPEQVRTVTYIGLLVNILLSIFKFIGGWIGTSHAVIADAVHSLSDSFTDIAILIGSRFWSQPPDECHPYGHRRIETIVTFFIGFVLMVTGVLLAWEALSTIQKSHPLPTGWIPSVVVLLSIVIKEALYQWTRAVGIKAKSPSLLANAWHHRSDALSSAPAFLAVAVASIFPSWAFIDHIGAAIVSIFIFHAALTIITPPLKEILEAGAPKETVGNIEEIVLKEKHVRQVHKIRTRYLASCLIIDMHIMVDGSMTVLQGHSIAENVHRRILQERDDVIDVIIHIEPLEILD